jgi:hypothetical protein
MSDLSFYDAVVLGAILLSVAFLTLLVGFWFLPVIWIPLVCGWPLIIAIAALYLPVKEAIVGAIRGPGRWYPEFAPRPRQPPPKFCHVCGAVLEDTSRYRRGFCPECREYR